MPSVPCFLGRHNTCPSKNHQLCLCIKALSPLIVYILNATKHQLYKAQKYYLHSGDFCNNTVISTDSIMCCCLSLNYTQGLKKL